MKQITQILYIYAIFIIYCLFLFKKNWLSKLSKYISKHIDNWLKSQDRFAQITYCILIFIIVFIGAGIYLKKFYNFDSALLSYSGSIIGGTFTLLGVFLTIEHNNFLREQEQKLRDKERKEELAIQYKPYFLSPKFYTLHQSDLELDIFLQDICDKDGTIIDKEYIEYHKKREIIKSENTGRGEAIIEKITINPICNTNEINLSIQDYQKIIFPSEFLCIPIHITIYNLKELKGIGGFYRYEVIINFTDLFLQEHYEKKFCIDFISINPSKEEGNIEFDENGEVITELIIQIGT